MKKKIIKLKNKPFIRNVAVIASGTVAAQVIALLASPIITRLFGPEAYGLMGLFQSSIQVIFPLAALTYPDAIVLPKSDQDARGLMRLSFYISILLSIFSFFIILIFGNTIVIFFNIETIESFILLFPLVILFTGLMQINEQWLIRINHFKTVAKTQFYRSFLINSGRVGIGYFYPKASVLIILTAIENGLRVLLMRLHLRKFPYKLNANYGNKSTLKELAARYKNFPIYRSPHLFIEKLQGNIPVILLTILFGPVATGLFSIARTVLLVPSQLIGKSIGDVFYPRISESINRKENISQLILKATIGLSLVGIIPYGLIMAFGPWLFSFVFGSDWLTAGEYARWMSFWIFTMFVNRPCSKALPAMLAQTFQLKYTIFTLIFRLLAFIIGYLLFSNAVVALAFLSVVAGILNIGLIIFTLRISKKFDKKNLTETV